ncbi:hypothetical protein [Paracoccus saliphilus]|uniref:Uncharacterized protein n=1 Tax=Paracoccus saliphilus TaxID=405559 RepID=A0AA45W6I3_9RHOB|nr:hypothetical protein [Paracoccus saliphilus]WCR04381.1 hypothetical protein JHX88_06530 [Paracoccus saliphilus]SIT02110.1 hypothetical protein SAMN05421772_112141 [Paracoccus saliphilus]
MTDRTYFGLPVVRGMVRQSDIEALPFAEFWRESASGSTVLRDSTTGEQMIYLHDWERFCRLFIATGRHRYSPVGRMNLKRRAGLS